MNAKQQRLINELHNIDDMIAMHEEMMVIAKRYGYEPELERHARNLDEWYGELDDVHEKAIDSGLTYEEIVTAVPNRDTAMFAARASR